MTVLELIDELEEIENVDVIFISKNGRCEVYEGEDIEYIEDDILNLPVIDYDIRLKDRKGNKCRIVDIKC